MRPDSHDHLSEEQLADLARLADGTLPAERHAEVEADVASSPELSQAFATQAVALDALQNANRDTGAPAQLRAQLERRQTRGARPSSRARTWRGALAAGVAAAVALAVALPGFLSSSLSVTQAAAFA